MDNKIYKMIEIARKEFKIDHFPGNFFNHIIKNKNYIEENGLVLFKQDLGEDTSGFIYYTSKNRACICINYKCSIGHQNFTLAHEIGHMYLHKGVSYNDDDNTLKLSNKDIIEEEANEFAAELLYPMQYLKQDIKYVYDNELLNSGNEFKLGDFINECVKKYHISFRFALLRILFNSSYKDNHCVLKKVEEVIDLIGPLNKRYEKEMYCFTENNSFYMPFIGILEKQREIGRVLVDKNEMGYASVNAIIEKSQELEGFDGTLI